MAVYGPGYPKYGREGRPIRRRTISSVKKACDRLWSGMVRAGGACEHCGKTPEESQLHAHHVVGRNNHRLRYEPRNGVCLCAGCHRYFHDNPLEFADWFRSVRHEDADYLAVERQKGLIRRDLQDYLDLERSLTELVKGGDAK